jgi:hypothetical protein
MSKAFLVYLWKRSGEVSSSAHRGKQHLAALALGTPPNVGEYCPFFAWNVNSNPPPIV